MANITWRSRIETIEPYEVKDIVFMDTKPNAFYIKNSNESHLYISMNELPRKNRYDVHIPFNTTDVFGRPIPCQRIGILNDSNKRITLAIYSAEDAFDMNLLKNFNVDLGEDFKDSAIEQTEQFSNLLDAQPVQGKVNLASIINALNNLNVNVDNIAISDVSLAKGTAVDLMGTSLTALQALKAQVDVVKGLSEDIRNLVTTLKTEVQTGIHVANNLTIDTNTPLQVSVGKNITNIDYQEVTTTLPSTGAILAETRINQVEPMALTKMLFFKAEIDCQIEFLYRDSENAEQVMGHITIKAGETLNDLDLSGIPLVRVYGGKCRMAFEYREV